MDEARVKVADMLGATKKEITFTSGGTESNHLAIWSALALYKSRSKMKNALGVQSLPVILALKAYLTL